jgi:hypothetical protein
MAESLLRRYTVFKNRDFRRAFILSVLLFAVSLIVNFYAIGFATDRASNRVTDIVLSNTPVFEVDGLLIYGTGVVIAFTLLLLLLEPKRAPFALYGLALFILIRSVFVMLTHLAPFEVHYMSDFSERITNSFFGADLFFSGHTGMPFLGVLAFWHVRWIRYLLMAVSAYFATVVLLGHLHYSIDVLAAFFITYGIFHIAVWAFPTERQWFIDAE